MPIAACFSLGFDPLPENTRILFNLLQDNGTNLQFPGVPGADLFWTGAGTGNCWRGNRAADGDSISAAGMQQRLSSF
ncbi:MAG TPA: hypothetical protein VLA83_08430 [Candidatus Binatia bacterium]|nr:hypothetical protein [Candidatus Binatia bacterium]